MIWEKPWPGSPVGRPVVGQVIDADLALGIRVEEQDGRPSPDGGADVLPVLGDDGPADGLRTERQAVLPEEPVEGVVDLGYGRLQDGFLGGIFRQLPQGLEDARTRASSIWAARASQFFSEASAFRTPKMSPIRFWAFSDRSIAGFGAGAGVSGHFLRKPADSVAGCGHILGMFSGLPLTVSY